MCKPIYNYISSLEFILFGDLPRRRRAWQDLAWELPCYQFLPNRYSRKKQRKDGKLKFFLAHGRISPPGSNPKKGVVWKLKSNSSDQQNLKIWWHGTWLLLLIIGDQFPNMDSSGCSTWAGRIHPITIQTNNETQENYIQLGQLILPLHFFFQLL